MSATALTARTANAPPDFKARVSRALLMLNVAGGLFALFAGFAFVARSVAASIATDVVASEPVLRSNLIAELAAVAGYVAVVPIFYRIFRPVSSGLSLAAAFVGLVGSAVLSVNTLNLVLPLLLLKVAPYAGVFDVGQLQSLALTFLRFHRQGASVGIVYFGLYCLLIVRLVFKSAFLPRRLTMPLMIAAACWLIVLLALGMKGIQ